MDLRSLDSDVVTSCRRDGLGHALAVAARINVGGWRNRERTAFATLSRRIVTCTVHQFH